MARPASGPGTPVPQDVAVVATSSIPAHRLTPGEEQPRETRGTLRSRLDATEETTHEWSHRKRFLRKPDAG
jgi:hypothetical protein